MEVHHHSHTPPSTGSGHRKKWKHYLWEFLMLFLAVFCGFLAEYQLEHTIENQRAKVYAKKLYDELKKDTAALNFALKQNKLIIGQLDTLCLYGSEREKRKVTNGMLYYYSAYVTWISFFVSATTTMEQLKNSGNLRIMGNEIAQKISQYGKRLNELANEYSLSRSEFGKLEDLYLKIFDGYQIQSFVFDIYDQSNPALRDSVFKLNIPLINDDPKLMKEFIGWVSTVTGFYRAHDRNFHIPLKKTIIELMEGLKKTYQLK
jgi:hypothetical protein